MDAARNRHVRRRVQRRFRPVDQAESQPPERRERLWVGAAHDSAERSADSIADVVMRRIDAGSLAAPGDTRIRAGTRAGAHQRNDPTLRAGTRVLRSPTGAGSTIGPEGGEVDDALTSRIRSKAGGGGPLDPAIRSTMEHAFGADFGRVRLHADRESASLSRDLGATAFTLGSDIHFGAEAPRVGTPSGTRLLAHELAHVVQQNRSITRHPSISEGSATGSRIQRFTTREASKEASPETRKMVATFQRSSDQGGIIQIGKNEIVARNDILEASEATLKKQGSFIELVGSTFSPGYSRVKVKFRGATPGTRRDDDVERLASAAETPSTDRIAKLVSEIELMMGANEKETDPDKMRGAQGANRAMEAEKTQLQHPSAKDLFVTIRDCHRTARTIMGDLGITRKEEHIVFSDTDGTIQKAIPSMSEDNEGGATVAQAGAVRFLKLALTAKLADLAHDWGSNGEAIEEKVRAVAMAWDYKEAMKVYAMIQGDPVAKDKFNTTFGVNDRARVAVGQALTQVNDMNERKLSLAKKFVSPRTNQLEDLWNFHWAGVVLTDGSDYVTLQAVADQQATTTTVDWWFKMYGSGDQSFHTEESEDSHVGTRPLTLSVEATLRERKKLTFPPVTD